MQRHEEIYDMIRDYEESDDATEDMLSLASEIDALTAERDRLAAENAELKARQADVLELSRHYSLNYTDIRAILYPENET